MSLNIRYRACGAVIYENKILMVKHSHDGRIYWTLPGGQIEANETPADAAVREVSEETGLQLDSQQFLFSYQNGHVHTSCYLMTAPKSLEVKLGSDPEDAALPASERMLIDIAWHEMHQRHDDIEVSQVIDALQFSFVT